MLSAPTPLALRLMDSIRVSIRLPANGDLYRVPNLKLRVSTVETQFIGQHRSQQETLICRMDIVVSGVAMLRRHGRNGEVATATWSPIHRLTYGMSK
jgi:hypothetical protein